MCISIDRENTNVEWKTVEIKSLEVGLNDTVFNHVNQGFKWSLLLVVCSLSPVALMSMSFEPTVRSENPLAPFCLDTCFISSSNLVLMSHLSFN